MDVQPKLDKASFQTIADFAFRESGLTLVDQKSKMIQSRLRHRLRSLKLKSFAEYCAFIQSGDGHEERKQLISALTTNVSHFFREKHHFETLVQHVAASMPKLKNGSSLRIWSAGCSNGQEAVSIAIRLLSAFPQIDSFDVRILATDIDPEVISFAKLGNYPQKFMNGVNAIDTEKYFVASSTINGEETFSTSNKIKNLIRFNELNLLRPWPMKGLFDVILCRNVVIYFDLDTQNALWPRFRDALKPDGLLFLGHSERISTPSNFGFECSGPTTYSPAQTNR
jgi:chemotaxis protein methyltransferase CheR